MTRRRKGGLLALAAGLIVVIGGTAGLVLTRHAVAANYGPAPTVAAPRMPAPTAPIVAKPQATPSAIGKPVALTIPAIGVQTNLVTLGLTASGALQVPSTTSVAGWYTGSPRPGAVGSAVIAGHIDSYLGPGVFYRLDDLKSGDKVYVKRSDGSLAVFQVTRVSRYAKDAFPTGAVYGATPDPELRLITCGGTFDYTTRSYLSNTVVYAVESS